MEKELKQEHYELIDVIINEMAELSDEDYKDLLTIFIQRSLMLEELVKEKVQPFGEADSMLINLGFKTLAVLETYGQVVDTETEARLLGASLL